MSCSELPDPAVIFWKCEVPYCRLCWCQARLRAKAVVGQPTDETDVRDRLAAVRHHQLFFVGMHYRRRPIPAARTRGGRRGALPIPPPSPAWRPDPGWQPLPLFTQIPRDYSRLALADADLTSPWLAWAKYLAHRLAETRGWGRNIRFAVNRGLALVLTGYVEGDVIRHTEIFAPLRALDLPVGHTVTVLDEMGIFEDDSEPSFERWLAERLEGLAPGIRSEAERWTRVLRDGGPRSLPRREGTVWLYLNRVRPALMEWSNPYDHLREVTRDDVLTYTKTLHGHQRHDQLVALRSLFTWAKRNGLIFRNPTSRIKVGHTSTPCCNRSSPSRSTAPSRRPPPRRRGSSSPSQRSTPPGSPRSPTSCSTTSTSATGG